LTGSHRPTVARVDLAAIVANGRRLAGRSGLRMLAVVKANAYGHGAIAVARALEDAGTDFFCVAVTSEGVELRRAGVRSAILLMNHSDARDAGLCRSLGLTPAVWSLGNLRAFGDATRTFRPPLDVHLKLDTGLTRLGLAVDELGPAAELLRTSPGLRVRALFTHFSHGDEPEGAALALQEERAREAFAAARAAGIAFEWTHLANSGAALAGKGAWCDAIRPGLSLYGVSPSADRPDADLVPALSWETEIMAVRKVPAGTAVGYGGTFVTTRPSKLAVLPIGYHDGYRRVFSGRVPILFSRGAAPIAGAISMDLTVCDVTDLSAEEGDRAALMGEAGGLRVTAHDLARAAGTIPYEIFCGIGSRVLRVYA
jgi:alanine racemase